MFLRIQDLGLHQAAVAPSRPKRIQVHLVAEEAGLVVIQAVVVAAVAAHPVLHSSSMVQSSASLVVRMVGSQETSILPTTNLA